jgi:mono/diheme cytochrome c family protein
MARRIFLIVAVACAAAFAVFWWLTATPTISALSAPAPSADVANGMTAFNAGGCASCHAVPNQPDRLKLGGGMAINSPFGTF